MALKVEHSPTSENAKFVGCRRFDFNSSVILDVLVSLEFRQNIYSGYANIP